MSRGIAHAHSIVEPGAGAKRFAATVVIAYALVALIPLLWIFLTGFKTPPDSISYPPKLVFKPSLEGYCNLFTTRSRQTPESPSPARRRPACATRSCARATWSSPGRPTTHPLRQLADHRLRLHGAPILLGVTAAYAFSRFKVPLKDDLLFFILSTRMMPPIAVAIPIYLMYRQLGLSDTRLGMILLYTAVNVSLAVWLLKASSTRSRASTKKPR